MPDPREQAEAVARWCGWKHTENRNMPWRSPRGVDAYRLPPFADSLDAMREVEDEIERRGLQDRYEEAFHATTGHFAEEWEFLTATAEQRIEAMVRMLDRIEGGKDG